jgi:ATP-binding cassette subfamily B protein
MRIPLKQYSNLLVHYVKPQWPKAALLAILLLSNIGLQLANPQIMRHFIDVATLSAGSREAPDMLLRAALLFLGVALIQQVVSILATYVSENVGWTATNALRADLTQHCLQLDLSFHNAHTPGEMIERIDGDVTALSDFFSQFVIQIVGNALLLIGVLALLFREDWRASLALTLFALVGLFILGRLRNIAVPHWTAERQASADLFGFLQERLSGTEDIRSNGAKAYVMRSFYQLMRTQMQKTLKAGLMVNVLINITFVLFAVGTATAFAVSALLFQAQVISIGTVYLIFHYTRMLEQPINRITRQMQELQRAGASISRTQELFQTESKIQAPSHVSSSAMLPYGPLAVAFQDVTFGYDDAHQKTKGPSREIVLLDVSFRLKPGTVLGLLGRTGSGKTTLTRLLFRLYDPESGSVRVGDPSAPTDIRQLPLAHLRQRVSMVTQNVQLFHATVRDNLTFFDRSVPDAQILDVIHNLELGEWFQSLPDGLDTVLESGGGGLSAGEAQLLAFTRIFLQDPGLVILDEASSRLDPATQQLIERAVDRLVQNRSAIIIAHRLGTVQRADEIMILENGRISEHGVRPALANDPASRFYGLLQTGLEEVLV